MSYKIDVYRKKFGLYKLKQSDEGAFEKEKERRRSESLRRRCCDPELLTRIDDAIQIHNEAASAGIEFDESFYASCNTHRIGFVRCKGGKVEDAGCLPDKDDAGTGLVMNHNGPAGIQWNDACMNTREMRSAQPLSDHMERFLRQWPIFEDRFYKYLDGILDI